MYFYIIIIRKIIPVVREKITCKLQVYIIFFACFLQVIFQYNYMKKIKKRSLCPISQTLDIIGDKWSLLIIRDILFKSKSTFGELLSMNEKIATNILADRLAFLKKQGFINSYKHPENKLKIVYTITQKGFDLLPVLMELVLWGKKYFDISDNGKELAKAIRKDRKLLVKKVKERHLSSL